MTIWTIILFFGMGWVSYDDTHPVSSVTTVEVEAEGWGDARPEDVHKILLSVVECMESKSGVTIGKPLRVQPTGGPMVLYKREPDGGYRVCLQVSGRYWSQLVYQFSHEVGHILARYQPKPGPQAWLEEAVCEALSFQVLKSLSISWNKNPPFESLRDYSRHLMEYADAMASRCKPVKESGLSEWYQSNREQLEKGHHDRPLIRVFSCHFSGWLEQNPELWKRVPDLGKGSANPGETMIERVNRWTTGWGEGELPWARKMLEIFKKMDGQADNGSSKSQP